jgi:hypothetical protein
LGTFVTSTRNAEATTESHHPFQIKCFFWYFSKPYHRLLPNPSPEKSGWGPCHQAISMVSRLLTFLFSPVLLHFMRENIKQRFSSKCVPFVDLNNFNAETGEGPINSREATRPHWQ